MPRGDRTGPTGLGPLTGRGAGYCAGYPLPGYANPLWGRGFPGTWPRPWGGGRGWRHWYYATGLPGWARFPSAPAWGTPAPFVQPFPTASREQQVELLKRQADWFKQNLDAVSQRIADLEKTEQPRQETPES